MIGMVIKNAVNFEPVKTLAAVLSFGSTVILGLAYNQHWAGEAVALISTSWTAFIAVVGTFFINSKVTSNASLDTGHRRHRTRRVVVSNPAPGNEQ